MDRKSYSVINVTNGDSAIEVMQKGRIAGEFLSWKDVLHVGPVPADLDLSALSALRAQYGSEHGWGTLADVQQDFYQRDQVFLGCHRYEHIRLWFEHDLYDQLQLLQILDGFYQQPVFEDKVTLVCTDNYLGMQDPNRIHELLQFEQPVTAALIELAHSAWQAFRSSSPLDWYDLLTQDTQPLSFLKGAIARMLQEYPSVNQGLSLTEWKILNIIKDKPAKTADLFCRYQATEEPMFMGDLTFFDYILGLNQSPYPLLYHDRPSALSFANIREAELSISQMGLSVLREEVHLHDLKPINRWLGGVQLTPENYWCWDQDCQRLVKID